MIKEDERLNIGLSQFKVRQKEIVQTVTSVKRKKELKLSDLMRGTNC